MLNEMTLDAGYSHDLHPSTFKPCTPFLSFPSTSSCVPCLSPDQRRSDLKLDNVLMGDTTPPRILLTDFGFSKRWGRGQQARMHGYLGTLVYSAPELLHDDEYEATVRLRAGFRV